MDDEIERVAGILRQALVVVESLDGEIYFTADLRSAAFAAAVELLAHPPKSLEQRITEAAEEDEALDRAQDDATVWIDLLHVDDPVATAAAVARRLSLRYPPEPAIIGEDMPNEDELEEALLDAARKIGSPPPFAGRSPSWRPDPRERRL